MAQMKMRILLEEIGTKVIWRMMTRVFTLPSSSPP